MFCAASRIPLRSRAPRSHLSTRIIHHVPKLSHHASPVFAGCCRRRRGQRHASGRPAGPWAISRPTRGRCSPRSACAIKAGPSRKSIPFADFAALADVDAKVLAEYVEKTEKKQGKKPDAYKDYRKILDRKDIDAVMIATPDHWHTKIAVEAMQAGKDVYCEKPLTLTIDEGKLIEKVVKETGRVFQVGTMQRTEIDQRFLQAIALVKHGRIGTVKKVTCGINGMKPSPVDSRGSGSRGTRLGLLARPGTEGRLSGAARNAAKATAAACRCTATATTPSATGTNTPAASSPTGAPITSTSPAGRSAPPRPARAR